MEKKIIGRCLLCGGNVVKTCKGYRCENNIAEQPTCVLNINGIIGNRKMSDEEIAELLEHRFILLDGFASRRKSLPFRAGTGRQRYHQHAVCHRQMPALWRRYSGGYTRFQLLQLQQPAGAVQLCHLAQHRWSPAESDRSQGNL